MTLITVLKNEVTTPPGKTYQVCELGYRTDDGKTKGMRIFNIVKNRAIFEAASNAKVGDVLEAQFQQSEKGFWEFGRLAATGEKQATTAVSNSNAPAPRGNWETSEERAAKQDFIIRQSSISSAISFFEGAKARPAVEDILKVADQFRNYVFGKPVISGDEIQ